MSDPSLEQIIKQLEEKVDLLTEQNGQLRQTLKLANVSIDALTKQNNWFQERQKRDMVQRVAQTVGWAALVTLRDKQISICSNAYEAMCLENRELLAQLDELELEALQKS